MLLSDVVGEELSVKPVYKVLPCPNKIKPNSIRRRFVIPSGNLAVYIGAEQCRFVIPTQFLNLPIFVSLLKKVEEEFRFQTCSSLLLPCEVGFFKGVLKILEKGEQRFYGVELEEVFKTFFEVSFDPCKEMMGSCHGFTHLLQKTRV
ncbi:auxin-responsive protein SAUR41-like [Magnolia sinica]|uniref:auxin-responsive protein SAUR41-like n=1 Tax=Magnolia sinica TaxID=86752 RepID=UPI002657CB34|nr:auxin-responsive protein SAUR41-like [Magnolia sinica]